MNAFLLPPPLARNRRPRTPLQPPLREARRRIASVLTPPDQPRATLIDDAPDGASPTPPSAPAARAPPSKSAQNGVAKSQDLSPPHASNAAAAAPPDASEEDSGMVEATIMGNTLQVPARGLLYAVPFMWGSFGVAVRFLFSHEPHIDAPVFNTARLSLSSLVYMPILVAEAQAYLARQRQPPPPDEQNDDVFGFLLGGLELGVYVFLANVAQVLGLELVAAGRAAFLVQCQTVIVPVLAGLLGVEQITRKTWAASLVAISGVALLSFDHAAGAASSLKGDILELICAFFFSAYILRLGAYASRVRPAPLVATKILVQAVLSATWAFGISAVSQPPPVDLDAAAAALPEWSASLVALNAGVVLWTGVVCSALAGWAQTKGQKLVPASETVVIFASQPLWASALAVALLGESFGPKGIAGGALIVASTLIATAKDGQAKAKEE